ncbi:uncharacterized protein LOC124169614 isoform X2 [Ischnura elegans]|uniref:uncharacterized protein LOC124169614 isoform X2 n=1 Tax=Ischnura elegans TaxID=197161 RepID=UPI001ED8AAE5|nr:uncharacterized protein LOC124169614 isoform X2 [Ischnura elegans]
MKSPDSKDRPQAGGKAKTAAGSSRPSPSNRTKTDYDGTPQNRTDWWESKIVTLDMDNKGPAGQRVERLMGTSVVKFTDRKYMMQLQEKILESHYESTEKRMNNRMNEEIEREKRLILENKMPAVDVPGIANHPVFVVRSHMANNPRYSAALGASKKRYAKPQDMETAIRAQEEQEKRMDAGSRVKRKKKHSLKDKDEKEGSITTSRVSLDTAEGDGASTMVLIDPREFAKKAAPESKLAAGRTRRLLRTGAEDGGDPDRQDGDMHTATKPALDDSSDNGEWGEDEESMYQIRGSLSDHLGYSPSLGSNDDESSESNCSSLSSGKDTERIKYEAPLVKELRRAETVEQLYELAEQIVGPVPPCVPSK